MIESRASFNGTGSWKMEESNSEFSKTTLIQSTFCLRLFGLLGAS